tara:strand:+ start:283 stop:513 length:231 start_codon:yes stop_codon:yes gene_type:complete
MNDVKVKAAEVNNILQQHPKGLAALKAGGEFDEDLFDALYNHYMTTGEMPYGTAKGRDGDPEEWIVNQLIENGIPV